VPQPVNFTFGTEKTELAIGLAACHSLTAGTPATQVGAAASTPTSVTHRPCDECRRPVRSRQRVNVQCRGGDVRSLCPRCADAASLTSARIFAPDPESYPPSCLSCDR
jgi:hypothetical protein